MGSKHKVVKIRNPFNYDVNEVSHLTGLMCTSQTLAVQSQKEEADINTILRKFGVTGQLPQNIRMPQYGDFTGIGDYQSALAAVKQAEQNFMMLPAELRERFNHNPQEFVEFCENKDNKEEAKKLGLLKDEPAVKGGVPPTETGGKPVAEKTQ